MVLIKFFVRRVKVSELYWCVRDYVQHLPNHGWENAAVLRANLSLFMMLWLRDIFLHYFTHHVIMNLCRVLAYMEFVDVWSMCL